MKSSSVKFQRRIDSLEADMGSWTDSHLDPEVQTQKLEACARELMADANTEDQQLILAHIDRLRLKHNLPPMGTV